MLVISSNKLNNSISKNISFFCFVYFYISPNSQIMQNFFKISLNCSAEGSTVFSYYV
nr:MAG TPA: hypothetical protein [Caudoviricetes sp.]